MHKVFPILKKTHEYLILLEYSLQIFSNGYMMTKLDASCRLLFILQTQIKLTLEVVSSLQQ